MNATEPVAATEAELRDQCGHVCLKDSQHVYRREPHFYGYRGGPWSIHGMMDRIDRLEEENERIRELLRKCGDERSRLRREVARLRTDAGFGSRLADREALATSEHDSPDRPEPR